MSHFLRQVWRVRWMVALVGVVVALRSFGVLYPTWPGTVVANKPVGACLGGIIGLIYVQQAFPYEDHATLLHDAMDRTHGLEERRLAAWLYTALSIKRGLVIAAFALAVASSFQRSPLMRSIVGSAGRRLLGAVGVALLLTACAEVAALIGPMPRFAGPSEVTGSPPPTPPPMAIPAGAIRYRAFLMQAWQYHFAMAEDPAIGFGQVHQESRFDCEVVSAGGSLGCAQFVPATAEWINGLIPASVRATCPKSSGCPLDPKWALTALVEFDWRLWSGNAWAATPGDRWPFALAGYNGGGVVTGAERAACASGHDCNPARYFDNVKRFCGSTGRSAASCRENRQYPRVILEWWAPAYHRWLQG